ncbi:hypothetical protein Tco_1092780 [Tanacetum coccineum]|uniref:Uncharacterized protein n=1 Tax=Tanacetum coccineum TaxID=301880 RepID=A0ABQ5IAT6_9ASTR
MLNFSTITGYIADSDPEEDPEEDPDEDPVDYPTDGGDEEEESFGDDVDDEDEEEASKDDDGEEAFEDDDEFEVWESSTAAAARQLGLDDDIVGDMEEKALITLEAGAWVSSEDRSAAIEAHFRTLEAQVATLMNQTSSL